MWDQTLLCLRKAVSSQISEAGISEEEEPGTNQRVTQGAGLYLQDLDFLSLVRVFGSLCETPGDTNWRIEEGRVNGTQLKALHIWRLHSVDIEYEGASRRRFVVCSLRHKHTMNRYSINFPLDDENRHRDVSTISLIMRTMRRNSENIRYRELFCQFLRVTGSTFEYL
jgi:hypothetical protein